MSIWIPGKIIQIKHWTNRLFSIYVNASINPFIPGQFTKIGAKLNNKFICRAYSYLNDPSNPNLEFYITKIKSGTLTTVLHNLHQNDDIMISKESYGKFILKEIPKCDNLWMIASGTGIAPYLSILDSFDKKLSSFSKIILIHAVRYSKNLNYLTKMIKLTKKYQGQLLIQTILSQEFSSHTLFGRIPNLIENNILEKKIGLYLNQNSHIMLCGNPHMIIDIKNILYKKYKMISHSSKIIGQITQERYW